MIRPFRGRALPQPGDKVKAYRRLSGPDHTVIKWSLKDPRTGLVIGHATEAVLTDVEFIVSEPGRQRVLASGQRNVHAYAVGTLAAQRRNPAAEFAVHLHYDPRLAGYFYDDDGHPVSEARKIRLDTVGKMWA